MESKLVVSYKDADVGVLQCGCGASIRNYPANVAYHNKSKKHQKWIETGEQYSDAHIHREFPIGDTRRYERQNMEEHRRKLREAYYKRRDAKLTQ